MEKKINIAIIGYGKMGREVERLALEKGYQVVARIDNDLQWETQRQALMNADAAIEFTAPVQAPANIEKCFGLGIPVVCGTTGWQQELPRITSLCREMGQALFHSPNFSIGVNIFFDINRRLASLMRDLQGYRPSIMETHHIQKLDAPSGTAVALANDILAERRDLKRWALGQEGEAPDMLSVEARRIEGATGTHTVTYTSPIDTIEIKHTSHNRSGFAEGALLAAVWLTDKKGVFTMKDLLNL
jgi:4-hydroxy-tetrahydrodipicolinate reductase